MGEDASNALAQAMNRLWAKHLPQIEERVMTLELTARSLANGTLTEAGRQHASADAHRLAGILGTFGLNEGTELAREVEAMCESPLDQHPPDASRLAAIAERLKTMVANRA